MSNVENGQELSNSVCYDRIRQHRTERNQGDVMHLDLYEYLAHMIISDGQIDDREFQLLDSFMQEANAEEELYQAVNAVYADLEDKRTFNQLVDSIRNLHDDQLRREALAMGFMVAWVDGYMDPAEEAALEYSRQRWGIPTDEYNQMKRDTKEQMLARRNEEQDKESEESIHPFFYTRLGMGMLKIASRFAGPARLEHIKRLQTKLLLSGPEYTKAIELCGKIAENDYEYVKPILEQSEQSMTTLLNGLQTTIDGIRESNDEELDVKGNLEAIQLAILNKLQPLIAEQQQSLLKKKRAMHSFTISFLGKTKAGKSTLHAVVTGEGADAIGKGKQRTTRFNRVYNWKNIRIIDTPGIGAPGGKSDEEIAESVIDESDMICYVLKNDSIQESEFKFLGTIREKNKPFVILLNLKENLLNGVRFNEFLQDPEFMYTRDDEKSIKGHVDRIRRYAAQHYRKDRFDIIPVQLLAAQMSRMENYRQHAHVLFNASHICSFLDSIRLEVLEGGVIRRSQTILDGTYYTVESARKVMKEQQELLGTLLTKLNNSRRKSEQAVKRSYSLYADNLNKQLKSQFSELYEQVSPFANEYYGESKDRIEEAWATRVRSMGFEEKLRSGIEKQIRGYVNEIESYLTEVIEDLAIAEDMLKVKGMDIRTSGTFSFRNIFRLLTVGIGALSLLNPIFLVIGIIGQFFVNMFKSKQRKINEAIEKLDSSLRSSIAEQEKSAVSNAAKHFEDIHAKISNSLNAYFKDMIQATNAMYKQIAGVESELEASSQRLSKALAWRVVNYAKQEQPLPIEMDDALIASGIHKVERDFGKSFTIFAAEPVSEQQCREISERMQEDVTIKPIPTRQAAKEQAG